MNRYDHVKIDLFSRNTVYLCINTLTGYECLVHQGHVHDINRLTKHKVLAVPLCDDDKEAKRQSFREKRSYNKKDEN